MEIPVISGLLTTEGDVPLSRDTTGEFLAMDMLDGGQYVLLAAYDSLTHSPCPASQWRG